MLRLTCFSAAALAAATALVACSGADEPMPEAERAATASAVENALARELVNGNLISEALEAAILGADQLDDPCGPATFDLHNVRTNARIELEGSVTVDFTCPLEPVAEQPVHGPWRIHADLFFDAQHADAAVIGDFRCWPSADGIVCHAEPGAIAILDTDRVVTVDLAEPPYAGRMLLSDDKEGMTEPDEDGCFTLIGSEGEVIEVCPT